MRDRSAYTALIEDLRVAMDHVQGQYDSNRTMSGRIERRGAVAREPIDPDVIALAYTIHNLYNAVENYFLRIAKFFENHLEPATWHRDLVNRMAIEIEGLRPPLLSRASLPDFHELRAFRHVFRSLYDTPLDPEKVALANRRVQPAYEALAAAHREFLAKLTAVREAL
jgi:hypothetical protein